MTLLIPIEIVILALLLLLVLVGYTIGAGVIGLCVGRRPPPPPYHPPAPRREIELVPPPDLSEAARSARYQLDTLADDYLDRMREVTRS